MSWSVQGGSQPPSPSDVRDMSAAVHTGSRAPHRGSLSVRAEGVLHIRLALDGLIV